jgi:hypothetical protein
MFIYGATKKTTEEQIREDKEQMEWIEKWNKEHKEK